MTRITVEQRLLGWTEMFCVENRAITRDYRNMGAMIFGEPSSLDGIMETLGELEKEINT